MHMEQKTRSKFLPWPGYNLGPWHLTAADVATRLPRTPPFSRLLRHAGGYSRTILTPNLQGCVTICRQYIKRKYNTISSSSSFSTSSFSFSVSSTSLSVSSYSSTSSCSSTYASSTSTPSSTSFPPLPLPLLPLLPPPRWSHSPPLFRPPALFSPSTALI